MKDILGTHTSILILMGKDDRNVDADETAAIWAKALPADTPRCIRKLPGTTHGLSRSEWFDYQLSSQWPFWKLRIFTRGTQNCLIMDPEPGLCGLNCILIMCRKPNKEAEKRVFSPNFIKPGTFITSSCTVIFCNNIQRR